ncbi:MAG: serine protease [Spirochaetaceae bacterium]|jgi:hypothetical protein|nr:serine protease [Spirochaetaceae bacterium]
MKKNFIFTVAFALLNAGLLFNAATVSAQSQDAGSSNISEAAFKLIQSSVFEVVVDKAPDTRLTYDKELDMENVPFKERNDKYESIGTAFAISPTEVATAFHVIDLSSKGLVYINFYIRDAEGNVYEIDNVTSASNERDVLTCTVKNKTFSEYFKLQNDWTVGSTAFTVGNSLGEGIVVRQGLILGTIPENISGRWELLKTSADSSPGNSGGPLITNDGKVLGVVVSRKDNIQYTVPSKVLSETPKDKLLYWAKTRVSHAVLSNKLPFTYDASVSIPAHYTDVRDTLCEELYVQYVDAMEKLFSEAPEYLTGDDSLYLLNFSPGSAFPEIDYVNDNDDMWTLSNFKTNSVRLPDDGKLTSVKLSDFSITRMQKPRTVDLERINTDPQYILDLILKNNKSNRRFWGNEYRILSYGTPLTTGTYKDIQGKTWITVEWLIDYCDSIYICYILPTPSGPIMVSTVQYTASRDIYQWDIKKVCDHLHAVYTSGFDDWTTFLKTKKYLPEFLSGLNFVWQKDKSEFLFNYYNNISISSNKNVLNWSDDSEMLLTFCYYKEDGVITYGLDYVSFEYDGVKNDFFSFKKNFKPDARLGREFEDKWNIVTKQKYPFDNKPYISPDDNTGAIGSVVTTKTQSNDMSYSIFLRFEDPKNKSDISKRFDILKKSIKVN